MANASSFFSLSVPSLRSRINPSIRIIGSGFLPSEGISTKVFGSSSIEGSEVVSNTQSRAPRRISKGCKLVGSGSAVPTLQVSNDDLAKLVDTNDEWISVRTGIRNRRVLTG